MQCIVYHPEEVQMQFSVEPPGEIQTYVAIDHPEEIQTQFTVHQLTAQRRTK